MNRRTLGAVRLGAAALFLPIFASAGTVKQVAWEGATIAYDPEVWELFAPLDARDMQFTCIAADCPGRPAVYAYAWKEQADTDASVQFACDLSDADTSGIYGPLAMPPADASLLFTAARVWSGCRARDVPILEACAARAGIAYRLRTVIAGGCNHRPEMPEERFLELLRGIRPAVAPGEDAGAANSPLPKP